MVPIIDKSLCIAGLVLSCDHMLRFPHCQPQTLVKSFEFALQLRWTREKVRGAKVHKAGLKIRTWLTVYPVYKLYSTPVKRTFSFGVASLLISPWSGVREICYFSDGCLQYTFSITTCSRSWNCQNLTVKQHRCQCRWLGPLGTSANCPSNAVNHGTPNSSTPEGRMPCCVISLWPFGCCGLYFSSSWWLLHANSDTRFGISQSSIYYSMCNSFDPLPL